MNIAIGFFLICGIFFSSMGMDNLKFYFNVHTMILIFGGTLAILIMSNPTLVLKNLFFEILNLFKKELELNNVNQDFIKLSKNRFDKLNSKDELIKYAQELWGQGLPQDLFIVLISQKRKDLEQKTLDSVQCLKNLAKYPSALGMIGTVLGIVTLFKTLETNKANIGPAFAVALTATFFGLVLSNGLVMPLADLLQVRLINKKKYLQNIYQIILLINQNEPQQIIENEVKTRAA